MTDEPYIIFGSPVISSAEIEAVTKTMETCWIGTGPRVQEFQTKMAEYTGAKHALAVGSCTAALHLSMVVSGVGPGDEVVTTAMTFCATANSIVHTGAKPVFVDCERDSMNIDPKAIEAAITPRTKAIVPVHFAGRPCDMDAIGAIAKKHNLLVIEDAAHAIETTYKDQKVGSISDLTCFSFYVTKNITTGEGGMVTTNNPELAKKIQTYGLHGMSADAWSRFSDKGYKHYAVVFPGFKYNLTDLAASIGVVQMRSIEPWLKRRNEIWAQYDEAFKDLPVVRPAPEEANTTHARHLYTLMITDDAKVTRDEFMAEMHKRKIGTGVHYRALHVHPYYAERFGYVPEQFPNAYWIGERTVSIPLTQKLTDREVERVIAAVRGILGVMRAAVLVLVCACKAAPTEPPAPTSSCDGVDLDVVAACVRKVIAIEQRLPEDDAFGPMFASATGRGLDAACTALAGLVTTSGQPIAIESTSSEWDHFEDGTAARYLEYRVSSPACAEQVTFGVENTVGGP